MPSARAIATARQLRFRKRLGVVKRRRRKIPKQIQPRHLEDELERTFRRHLESVIDALAPMRRELPGLIASAQADRQDASEGDRLRVLFDLMLGRTRAVFNVASVLANMRSTGNRVSEWNKVQLNRQTRAGLGIDVLASDRHVREIVDNFANEQVNHMQDLGETTVRRIKGAVARAVSAATPHVELAKQLQDEFGIARKRARLIARNEVLTLNARINNERLKDMGIKEFVWRNVGDRRVRPIHKAIDGRKFDVNEGHATEGLPGEPVLCRCSSEPVFDGILAEV